MQDWIVPGLALLVLICQLGAWLGQVYYRKASERFENLIDGGMFVRNYMSRNDYRAHLANRVTLLKWVDTALITGALLVGPYTVGYSSSSEPTSWHCLVFVIGVATAGQAVFRVLLKAYG